MNEVQNFSQIPALCNMKKSFDTCIGATAIFQKCFNIDDFENVEFIREKSDSRGMIANYMQADLACGSAYEGNYKYFWKKMQLPK